MKPIEFVVEEFACSLMRCARNVLAVSGYRSDCEEWMFGGLLSCAGHYAVDRLHNQRGFGFDPDDQFAEKLSRRFASCEEVTEFVSDGFNSVNDCILKVYSGAVYDKISERYFATAKCCLVYPEQELDYLLPLYALKKCAQSRFGSQDDFGIVLCFDGSGAHSQLVKVAALEFAKCYDSFEASLSGADIGGLLVPDRDRMQMLGLGPDGECDPECRQGDGKGGLLVRLPRVWELGGETLLSASELPKLDGEVEE